MALVGVPLTLRASVWPANMVAVVGMTSNDSTGTMTLTAIWALTSEPSVAKAPMRAVPVRRPMTVAVPSPLSMMRI